MAILASALPSWGASGDGDALGAWGCGCPPALSPGSSALWTRTMPPGRAASTGYPPRGRETLTCRASGRSRWETARAIRPARRLEEAPEARRTGAACAELWSPARTAAAARRLQWSSAPQPLLSHGRGALAGRRSGLPAPGSGTPASPDRSRGLHGVPLGSHRAPFVQVPEPVWSLASAGIRGVPRSVTGQTLPVRDSAPRFPRVQSSRGGSAGLERRGREGLQRSGHGAVGEGFTGELQPGGLGSARPSPWPSAPFGGLIQ